MLAFLIISLWFGQCNRVRLRIPPNGLRFSRREASAASEAVGWMRRLGGIQR